MATVNAQVFTVTMVNDAGEPLTFYVTAYDVPTDLAAFDAEGWQLATITDAAGTVVATGPATERSAS